MRQSKGVGRDALIAPLIDTLRLGGIRLSDAIVAEALSVAVETDKCERRNRHKVYRSNHYGHGHSSTSFLVSLRRTSVRRNPLGGFAKNRRPIMNMKDDILAALREQFR